MAIYMPDAGSKKDRKTSIFRGYLRFIGWSTVGNDSQTASDCGHLADGAGRASTALWLLKVAPHEALDGGKVAVGEIFKSASTIRESLVHGGERLDHGQEMVVVLGKLQLDDANP